MRKVLQYSYSWPSLPLYFVQYAIPGVLDHPASVFMADEVLRHELAPAAGVFPVFAWGRTGFSSTGGAPLQKVCNAFSWDLRSFKASRSVSSLTPEYTTLLIYTSMYTYNIYLHKLLISVD